MKISVCVRVGLCQFFSQRVTNLLEHDCFGLESISRPNVLEGVQDLWAVTVLLVAKLVCWEGQYGQLFVSEPLAEFIHLREVSGRGACEL